MPTSMSSSHASSSRQQRFCQTTAAQRSRSPESAPHADPSAVSSAVSPAPASPVPAREVLPLVLLGPGGCFQRVAYASDSSIEDRSETGEAVLFDQLAASIAERVGALSVTMGRAVQRGVWCARSQVVSALAGVVALVASTLAFLLGSRRAASPSELKSINRAASCGWSIPLGQASRWFRPMIRRTASICRSLVDVFREDDARANDPHARPSARSTALSARPLATRLIDRASDQPGASSVGPNVPREAAMHAGARGPRVRPVPSDTPTSLDAESDRLAAVVAENLHAAGDEGADASQRSLAEQHAAMVRASKELWRQTRHIQRAHASLVMAIESVQTSQRGFSKNTASQRSRSRRSASVGSSLADRPHRDPSLRSLQAASMRGCADERLRSTREQPTLFASGSMPLVGAASSAMCKTASSSISPGSFR